MMLFDGALAAMAVLAFVPAAVLFTQVAAARRQRLPEASPTTARPSVAILVPAHDEALTIRECLSALLPQFLPGDRLLVVADNCTDGTASIAAAMGAEVVERRDPERRGKGYALDYGVRHLAANPCEVVIIVDADSRMASGSVDRLARICAASARPVQALYLMEGAGGGLREFAWVVKNQVRPLGLARLGLPCQLMGTGMAFPWELIRSAPLANGNLVEDVALGLDLAQAGAAPLFCSEALVTSRFPDSKHAAATQRTRWEHGQLALILSRAPRLLVEAAIKRDANLLGLALDLCVAPLALLVLVLGALVVASAAFGSLPGFAIAGTAAVLVTVAVLVAWLNYGRHVVPAARLASAPLHALGKVSLYLKFAVQRQKSWVRSERAPEQLALDDAENVDLQKPGA